MPEKLKTGSQIGRIGTLISAVKNAISHERVQIPAEQIPRHSFTAPHLLRPLAVVSDNAAHFQPCTGTKLDGVGRCSYLPFHISRVSRLNFFIMLSISWRSVVGFLALLSAFLLVTMFFDFPSSGVAKNLLLNHRQSRPKKYAFVTVHEQPQEEYLGSSSVNNDKDESAILAALTAKLTTPREFTFETDGIDEHYNSQLSVHQFLHLHHMKTGGTSMDHYLRCAMDRLKLDKGVKIPYGNIHECSKYMYDRCKEGIDSNCLNRIQEAAIMSYCAPLKDLPFFSWSSRDDHGVDIASPPSHGAITVLRDPVERVWSMFRFQTKQCFKCMPLTEIYEKMDNGDYSDIEVTCYQQLQNHQTANLLSTEWNQHFGMPGWQKTNTTDENASNEDEALLAEAIQNMKSFFTVIGLTEHLPETIDIASRVFPWMAQEVDWSDRKCELSHANSSPRNNGCGPSNTHWNLPDHPDDETRAAIEAHNQFDQKLYAAAVEHFEKQLLAVGMDKGKR